MYFTMYLPFLMFCSKQLYAMFKIQQTSSQYRKD
uniref:Bm14443 n=1 Tax=Brugia malayi TaxID=6279 RepID=A0A1I9G6G9_BRUMA|nr:Bm14443 [Brugia malayi]